MYQKEITPELIAMSTGVALWSQARYGWFISSKISDKQIALELARELEQLSNHQLNFIEDAKENGLMMNMIDRLMLLSLCLQLNKLVKKIEKKDKKKA